MPEDEGKWWLVVILLGLLGGLVAFAAVREQNPSMAKAMLIFSLLWSFALYLMMRAVLHF